VDLLFIHAQVPAPHEAIRIQLRKRDKHGTGGRGWW
jgi:hypothetical protein